MCDYWSMGTNAQLEAIVYARVSDNRGGRSRSVDQQLAAGRRECERRGWVISKEIIDDDKGASRYSRAKRTGYEALLEQELRPGRVLVTWESSRAQRDLRAYIRLREICEETGALWCYDGQVYDMRDPRDRHRTGQDALDDELEVEKTRKRVLRDMRANAEAGRPHGKVAYGYRIVRDPRSGRAIDRVPDELTAPIVREIAERVLAGEAIRSIATDLNRRGIPAPRPIRKGPRAGQPGQWITQTITSLIKSPTYAGLRTVRGEVVREGTWQPILTREQHERIVALLSDPSRRTQRGTSPRWLLSYIATCGECGGTIARLKPRGHDMYTCITNQCVGRAVSYVDKLVEEAIIQRLESPDVLALLSSDDQAASEAYEEARTLRERLDSFIDQAAEGALSAQALARIEAKLRPQIAAAERRARAAISSPLVAELAGPHARSTWQTLTMPQKREVVRALVEIRIWKARKGMRRVNPRYIHLRWIGSDEPVPTGPVPPLPLAEGGDPLDYTIAEVLAHMSSADAAERQRILDAERAGYARGRILRLNPNPTRR
ncbi:Recombinase [Nocardia farcinica]|uniref:Recombinase n=2 Tax=Nocardia farcinica TaxID=37329 RepID=A0A449GQ65_NOCFR|nr:Recombinase [Nocardia farcinica]